MDIETQVEMLKECMINSDRAGAANLVDGLLEGGIQKRVVLDRILEPALRHLGDLWGCQQVSLSQAFVAGKIAEDILLTCLPEDREEQPEAPKGRIVIGNIEDDFHSLGRRIVISFLQAAHWEVHDLGNDVPAETFVEKALEIGASVIGASAMMQSTALNIRKLRERIDERGLQHRIKLAVGGAVFNWRPALVEEVGADGTAANAAEADRLFERLCREVSP